LGRTIIASNVPVFRKLLTKRENALLVDPNNSEVSAVAFMELREVLYCANDLLRRYKQ
jgi:hypothetical protein